MIFIIINSLINIETPISQDRLPCLPSLHQWVLRLTCFYRCPCLWRSAQSSSSWRCTLLSKMERAHTLRRCKITWSPMRRIISISLSRQRSRKSNRTTLNLSYSCQRWVTCSIFSQRGKSLSPQQYPRQQLPLLLACSIHLISMHMMLSEHSILAIPWRKSRILQVLTITQRQTRLVRWIALRNSSNGIQQHSIHCCFRFSNTQAQAT